MDREDIQLAMMAGSLICSVITARKALLKGKKRGERRRKGRGRHRRDRH